MKTAICTGVTGMDGSILSDKLINLGYKVFGLVRRSSTPTLGCSAHLENEPNFEVVEGDITDLSSLIKLCNLAKADLFFSMAAQSHVGISFKEPIHTAQVTGIGVLNCLEAIRLSGIHTKFLQASTSELYGGISPKPCNELTPFHPRSPYGIAKLFGYWTTVNYRESYKMFACNSICFNHEHPRRSDNFVTRKISKAVANIFAGKQDKLYLGNLEAKRDWGWAPDFCNGMIKILTQTTEPDDYVMATGETHTIREFCDIAFKYVGLDYKEYVKIDPKFYRPAEVDVLVGDYSKIKKTINWEPTVTFQELVKNMVDADLHSLNISI